MRGSEEDDDSTGIPQTVGETRPGLRLVSLADFALARPGPQADRPGGALESAPTSVAIRSPGGLFWLR